MPFAVCCFSHYGKINGVMSNWNFDKFALIKNILHSGEQAETRIVQIIAPTWKYKKKYLFLFVVVVFIDAVFVMVMFWDQRGLLL